MQHFIILACKTNISHERSTSGAAVERKRGMGTDDTGIEREWGEKDGFWVGCWRMRFLSAWLFYCMWPKVWNRSPIYKCSVEDSLSTAKTVGFILNPQKIQDSRNIYIFTALLLRQHGRIRFLPHWTGLSFLQNTRTLCIYESDIQIVSHWCSGDRLNISAIQYICIQVYGTIQHVVCTQRWGLLPNFRCWVFD